MKVIKLSDYSNLKSYIHKDKNVSTLEEFSLFNARGVISICGRPSSGKTTVLIDILIERNIKKKEISLFLFSDSQSLTKLLRKSVTSNSNNGNIYISESPLKTPEDIYTIIDSFNQKFDAIYIDDFDSIDFGFLDESTELEEESLINSIVSKHTKQAIQYLNYLGFDYTIFLIGHISRRPDIRGGDHKPYLSDIQNPLLEQVSSKILLVYRPENYRIPCDENGDSIEDMVSISIHKDNQGRVNYELKHKLKGYNKT